MLNSVKLVGLMIYQLKFLKNDTSVYLSVWVEGTTKLDDKNGFRRKRSTTDHVSCLSSIIETRNKKKLSTFAFIDFRKAYDCMEKNFGLVCMISELQVNMEGSKIFIFNFVYFCSCTCEFI